MCTTFQENKTCTVLKRSEMYTHEKCIMATILHWKNKYKTEVYGLQKFEGRGK